jgi:uncharacterized peroxidase-related enzyme
MPFVELAPEDAEGDVASIYEREVASWGFLPNYARALALRPEVYEAWRSLIGAVRRDMDPRRYELATVAAATTLRSSYCTIAHSLRLEEQFYEPAQVRDIIVDRAAASLDDVDVAVMQFAETVARDATAVTEGDVARLRDLGLSDRDVADVAFAAAARAFFTKSLDALGVQPDAELGSRLPPELRDVVEVGRPIEA